MKAILMGGQPVAGTTKKIFWSTVVVSVMVFMGCSKVNTDNYDQLRIGMS
jgi:hypothetical protein